MHATPSLSSSSPSSLPQSLPLDAEAILRDVRQAAEAQLHAARTLNPRALREASERRLSLMGALAGTAPVAPEALRRLQADLEPIDERLGRLLLAGQRALRRLQLSNTTYDPSGRIREGAR